MFDWIFIEAWHWKNQFWLGDPWATNKSLWLIEHEIVKKIANEVIKQLKTRYKWFVSWVGTTDWANLSKKIKYVNWVISASWLKKPFWVAIHINSNVQASWLEWYYQNNKPWTKDELMCVLAWLNEHIQFWYRMNPLLSSKSSRFWKLYIDDYKCDFILIEVGFIWNKKEMDFVIGNIPTIAEGIVDGILRI